MKKSYSTYVLECADQTFYCGFTTDLEQRLRTHQSGKGAKYTSRRLPVKLLTAVEFDNEHDARSCEWWFKHKLTRTDKEKLIQTDGIRSSYQDWKKSREKRKAINKI